MADIFHPLAGKKIWVAGETGLVGHALTRALSSRNIRLLTAPHSMLGLTNQKDTHAWLKANRPDVIFVAAAKVGGIGINASHPADFIQTNLSIALNVIEGAHRADVQRLVFLGSSCAYPKFAAQPIGEDSLLTGPLEETNEAYAVAKIAGMKMCEFYSRQYDRDYICAMPTNLYGPYDRFEADTSHVIPAMMMKFHEAMLSNPPSVTLWGTGTPLREFLHVDDLAAALLCMVERYDGVAPVNIGSGEEISIAALADMMKKITGYRGDIIFDASMPDGTPRKFLDSSKIWALGWAPAISLEDGLSATYEWFCNSQKIRKSA